MSTVDETNTIEMIKAIRQAMLENPKDYFSTKAVAQALNIHPGTVRRWAIDGKIAHRKTGFQQNNYFFLGHTITELFDQFPLPK